MQLSEYLNRTLFIIINMIIFILLFCNSLKAHTVTSNVISAKLNEKITFTSILTFESGNFGSTADAYIDYGDGTPEKQLGKNLPTSSRFVTHTLHSTHTYLKYGVFTVKVRTVNGSEVDSIGSDPAIMIQDVKSSIKINRIQLYFKNNRPEITLKRNQKPPELSVKIDYSGTGHLKGYWNIDGKKTNYVFKYLTKGPYAVIKYPGIPPIPTFQYGSHKVRFVITQPAMSIKFPYGIYFVTSDEKLQLAKINLLQPVEGEDIAYKPLTFKWKPVKKASMYLLSIFSKKKEDRIFSAYTKLSEYKLKHNILKRHMKPNEQYIWNVVGFNDQNKIIAESIPSAFSFNQKIAFLPGQILFITAPTPQGEKTIQEVKNKYGLEILQTYPVKTLGLQVTKFYTDKEIFSIISAIKQMQGVIAAQPDYIFKTISEPADEPLNNLQSLRKIIKIGQNIPFKGKGVTIAIIDTGVDDKHQDLAGAISSTVDCLPDSIYTPEIHGTAVAGLIGARKNNFGIDGYAPESKIFALRACKQISKAHPIGECYSSSIAKALNLAIEQGVQIVNMSLGTNVEDKLISKLINAGSKKGILFVAPAGNNSESDELFFPASHSKVISVAGITKKGELYPNAKIAKKSDFYLPCENLFSTIPNNKHNFLSGTSLSGAVVSGLLALVHEKNKDIKISQIKIFDGDINKWIDKFLKSEKIATQKEN